MAYYHGTRAHLAPGDLIHPSPPSDPAQEGTAAFAHLSPDLDKAIWDAEVADGDALSRVYIVEATGPLEDASGQPGQKPPGPGWRSYRSRQALRVLEEVTDWLLYHGTRADLKPGDLLEPGYKANFGEPGRMAGYIYFTRTLNAAAWGAELAQGEGPGRVYTVEPTGPVEDDPNLTDKKFRGNPTKAFRSRDPLRVTGEVLDWPRHAPEAVQAMKAGLERLKQLGEDRIDD